MRPGRVVVVSSLPGLALLGVLQASPPPVQAPAQGQGAVVVRVTTDGRPVVLPARPRPAVPAPPPTKAVPRPSPRATSTIAAPEPVIARPAPPDTYPFKHDTTGEADPWGFTKRQCVSYVAWRLAEAARPLDNARDQWGSALQWDETAARLGRTVTSRPSVGAVAHWNAGERGVAWTSGSGRADGWFTAGGYGHVAWVTKAYADGSVQVAQYNGSGDRSFSTLRVRAPRYLLL